MVKNVPAFSRFLPDCRAARETGALQQSVGQKISIGAKLTEGVIGTVPSGSESIDGRVLGQEV
jgi:hypothetical protein